MKFRGKAYGRLNMINMNGWLPVTSAGSTSPPGPFIRLVAGASTIAIVGSIHAPPVYAENTTVRNQLCRKIALKDFFPGVLLGIESVGKIQAEGEVALLALPGAHAEPVSTEGLATFRLREQTMDFRPTPFPRDYARSNFRCGGSPWWFRANYGPSLVGWHAD